MIIELFGPPASGKTTFAKALVAALRTRGHIVNPMFSSRPSEGGDSGSAANAPGSQTNAAFVRRVFRPVQQILALAHGRPANGTRFVSKIIRAMPPDSLVWRFRLSQYLLRLSHSWQHAARSDQITIYDQAFVQFAGSLVLLARAAKSQPLANVLKGMPTADLYIRLQAADVVIEQRLQERSRRQGPIERLLEFDLQTNLASIGVVEQLERTLSLLGRTIVVASSSDPLHLRSCVDAIETHLNQTKTATA